MIVWRLRDALMAAGLMALATWEALVSPFSGPGFVGNAFVSAAATILLAGSVLIRRQAPLAYAAAVTVGTTVLWWQCRGLGELPAVGYSSYLLAGYTLGAHLPHRSAVAAGVITLAAWGVPDVIDARAGLPSVHQDMGFFVLAGLAVVAGIGVRALRERSDALRRALDDLAAERAAHAATVAAAERRRIARDMHDVLTHTMSAVAVQAGALRLRMSSGPEAAAVARLEASSRDAMRELRQLLDLLRDETPGLAPSPGLDDIDRLIDHLTATQVTVELHRLGTLGEVTPGQALVAYHLVQESLTNVGKHAGTAAHVDISLETADGNLIVTVVDDGLPPPPWQPGHGLTGMRERVASYGGHLDVGPTPAGGGWRVRGVLPI